MPDVYTWIAWAVAVLAFAAGVQVLGVAGGLLLVVALLGAMTAAAAVAGLRVGRRLAPRDPRFERTGEVFRDPRTGGVTRVHVDRATGERRYWRDL